MPLLKAALLARQSIAASSSLAAFSWVNQSWRCKSLQVGGRRGEGCAAGVGPAACRDAWMVSMGCCCLLVHALPYASGKGRQVGASEGGNRHTPLQLLGKDRGSRQLQLHGSVLLRGIFQDAWKRSPVAFCLHHSLRAAQGKRSAQAAMLGMAWCPPQESDEGVQGCGAISALRLLVEVVRARRVLCKVVGKWRQGRCKHAWGPAAASVCACKGTCLS